MKPSIHVVIPTIRDLSFFSSWGKAFSACHLTIIEDKDSKTVKVPHNYFSSISHYCWKDIQADFNKDEWIFSRHNAGIRSYGFWKAWKSGADIILTLDDDCYPVGDPNDFILSHIENLNFKAPAKWHATYPDPKWMFTRGFPYKLRNKLPVKVSHGIWSGALDLDGQTETKLPHLLNEAAYPPIRQIIPTGYYYPMCSMNLAFHRDVVPLMFFPMMGKDPQEKDWGYDRFDDIWAGVFSKKIMDHLGWSVVNGSPQVEHRKASNIHLNLDKEKHGLHQNELLWNLVDKTKITASTPAECYLELAQKCDFPKSEYFKFLRKAMIIWAKLFI